MEIPHAFLTFLLPFLLVVFGAAAVGFLPALVMIGYRKRYKMLTGWIILWLACTAVAAYALPQGMERWRAYKQDRFKYGAMYLGYFVGVLGAFFVFPEPMRQARDRLRHEPRRKGQDDDSRDHKRKRRRKKRRTHSYEG